MDFDAISKVYARNSEDVNIISKKYLTNVKDINAVFYVYPIEPKNMNALSRNYLLHFEDIHAMCILNYLYEVHNTNQKQRFPSNIYFEFHCLFPSMVLARISKMPVQNSNSRISVRKTNYI